jgi:SAM-dependent methyltransferase
MTLSERVHTMLGRTPEAAGYPDWLAYEPVLIPPPRLMRTEGITVLEEWFRWAEEWSMLLRVYGGLTRTSRVLEIGCGLGRVAFALRYVLEKGEYLGFEIVREKVEFLERVFTPAHLNFRFVWADVANTYYNPNGRHSPTTYRFPAEDASQDVVFAASVLTHMAPANAAHYMSEAARVLRPGGRCLLSVFLLDQYRKGATRPSVFARPAFDFDHHDAEWGDEFAFVVPENPEQMTAFSRALLDRFADECGLAVEEVAPGMWSGASERWVGSQDLLVLRRPA